MPSELVFDEWGGLTFGDNGTDPVVYGLVRSVGLDDVTNDGDSLTGAFDGSSATALHKVQRSWVTELDIVAADAGAWQDARDDLRAATSGTGFGEYTVNHRDDVWTVFARVRSREIPRDTDSIVYAHGNCRIAYEATDPKLYGPTTTVTFTGSSDSEVVTSAGWTGSERWKWVVPGPVTNPQISTNAVTGGVVRYVGVIPATHTLVVELLPRGQVPGYYAKLVLDADVANYTDPTVGSAAYGDMDRGATYSTLPPGWFAIEPGAQTISYSCTSGTGGSTFTWRPAYD